MKKQTVWLALAIIALVFLSGCTGIRSDNELAWVNCRDAIRDHFGTTQGSTTCREVVRIAHETYHNDPDYQGYEDQGQLERLQNEWGIHASVNAVLNAKIFVSCTECKTVEQCTIFGCADVDCCENYCGGFPMPYITYNPSYAPVDACFAGFFCVEDLGSGAADCVCSEESCQTISRHCTPDRQQCVECTQNSHCSSNDCDTSTWSCRSAPPPPPPSTPDCSSAGSSFIASPTEGQPIHGPTQVVVNIESAFCQPHAVGVKIDNTVECSNFSAHTVEGDYWVYKCTVQAVYPPYSDGSHTIHAVAMKGAKRIQLDRGIQICNDPGNDCQPEPPPPPVCLAECVTDPALACGTYMTECCSDPGNGCRTLKTECAGQATPGTHCDAGVCNPDGTCSCRQACTDRANQRVDVACNAAWPVDAQCAAENCGYSPEIGFKCNDPDTRCADNGGNIQCWSGDTVACGQQLATYLGPTITGLYCDAQNNSAHKLCDSALSTPGNPICVPTLDNLANSAKYLMDVSTDSQTGIAYNAWFKYRIDRSDSFAVFDKYKWFGFGYYEQPPLGSAINFTITNPYVMNDPAKQSIKEGLVRFEIENAQMSGPQNYVLFNMQDSLKQGGTKTEKIIFKLDAGYSGKCVPEDRKFKGQSGTSVKPKVSYDWGWGYHSTKMKQCDYNTGVYCDSTQFTIALFDRLQLMKEKAEDGNQAFAASLKEWDVNLMKDGFTNDFLLDFSHFENNSEFAGPQPWFKTTWTNYFGQPLRIAFSPNVIDAPGRYHAKLNITWHAGEWNFFDSHDLPEADIVVQFTKIADAEPMHPFYLIPFDFEVGKTKRPDEGAANRTGYGTNFQGKALPLSDSYSANPTGTEITVEKYDSFADTNPIGQRGKLLTIDLQNNSIVFSPVVATPVAMKLAAKQESNGWYAQGFYSLKSGGQEIPLESTPSLASWTGIGSKNLGDPCNGFHPPNPLFFRRSDKVPATGGNYCTHSDNTRGFWWDGLTENQMVFAQTVFYTPVATTGNDILNNYCTQNSGMDWVSPTEHLSTALNLNYTADQHLNAETVSDILNRVEDGTVCQYISPDKQFVVFYWDRNQLESAIDESDLRLIEMEPADRCNR